MFEILSAGYEFVCGFLPFWLVLIFFDRFRRRGGDNARHRRLFLSLFALYIMAVFHVTGAGTIYDAIDGILPLRGRVNLIPFSREIDPVGYILNAVMFLPFGFLVSMIWKQLGKPHITALLGLAFSLLIEMSQLLSSRGTDVDDLILNTLGAVLGCLAYRLWKKIAPGCRVRVTAETIELPAYILSVFLGRCMLFNLLGLIRLMYD